MAQNFVPNPDLEFVSWLENFKNKIGNYAALLEVSATDIAACTADWLWVNFAVQQVENFKTEGAERVAYKNQLRDGPVGSPINPYPSLNSISIPAGNPVAGVEPRVRALVQRIKNHPNFTPAIGEDLRLVLPPAVENGPAKPEGRAESLPNHQVEVSFGKRGFPAVVIEYKRGHQTEWSSAGIRMKSPCLLNLPPAVPGQPDLINFRMRYIKNDAPVGEYSDVFTAVSMP